MRHLVVALACVTGLSATVYGQNPTVQTIVLPAAMPDYATRASAINSRGVVTGFLLHTDRTVAPKAFTWTRTGGYRIVLDGAIASDINDSGTVIGVRRPCGFDGECDERGFIWTASAGATDLGEFRPGAINNKGTIVGECFTSFDELDTEGCIRTPDGTIRKLPSRFGSDHGAGDRFVPADINERGAVVGYYIRIDDGSTFVHRAAVWAPSFGLLDLDPDPAKRALAIAINESGTVVGVARGSEQNATGRAAAWTPLGRADATQGADSFAHGVSDRGWIVGTVSLRGHQQPALWLLGGRLVELPTPGGNAGGADDVNDSGFIIAEIRNTASGESHSVLWICEVASYAIEADITTETRACDAATHAFQLFNCA